jgi:predicted phosphodiesterase
MTPITIFGDIHGNFPALQAVLTDIERRGLKNLYCLGDLVGYGTFPNEVIATIRDRDIPTIKGNYDVGVGNSSDDCGCAYRTEAAKALGQQSIAWSNANTTDENKAFLRGLCSQIRLQMDDLRVLLVHGSPRKVNEYLYEDRPDSSFERILDQAKADVMVCGHTHLPYQKNLPSGRHVINAGSVGKPKDGDPRACYVVLDIHDGSIRVEFVRVEYDVMKTVEAIQATTMPFEFASMLQTATG